ncbi:MAG: yehT 1, partial [Acidobacteria bacterium]|nr:yehT 1 [Acidobacteriota bacterium]
MARVVALLRESIDAVPSALEARLAALEASADEWRVRRIAVRDGQRILLVDHREIDWVESAGNHAVIHCGPRTYVIRETLEHVGRELGAHFLRVRRDALVNAAAVRELHPLFRGEFRLTLRDGTHVQS